MKCIVALIWDDEAKVWIAESNDIPGLCLESASLDELIEDVRSAAPEMLYLNCQYEGPVYLIFEAVRIAVGIDLVS